MLICLIGIDGSGKTTQARILIERLQKKGHIVSYKHSYARKTVLDASGSRQYFNVFIKHLNRKASNRLVTFSKTLVRLSLIFADAWITFLANRTNQRRITISDRYFYDNFVGLATSHSELANEILFFSKVIPKPCITIVFNISPETAVKRKAEHSMAEAKVICDLYFKLSQITTNELIDAEQDLYSVAQEIEGIVCKKICRN